jgi:hypothetical protein
MHVEMGLRRNDFTPKWFTPKCLRRDGHAEMSGSELMDNNIAQRPECRGTCALSRTSTVAGSKLRVQRKNDSSTFFFNSDYMS